MQLNTMYGRYFFYLNYNQVVRIVVILYQEKDEIVFCNVFYKTRTILMKFGTLFLG